MSTDSTDAERRRNAMTYGLCLRCGAVRKRETISTYDEDGKLIVEMFVACENGHRMGEEGLVS